MAYKGQDVEWWDRELERRDKSTRRDTSTHRDKSGSLFEGSGGDHDDDDNDDDTYDASYDGREDDEDFAPTLEGSGSFSDDDDEEGSGSIIGTHNINDEDQERSSEPPKVNEPWTPWSKEEIEVIKPTSTSTTESPTTSSGPKTSSGFKTSGSSCLVVLLLSILCYVSSRKL
jgi:hypothetical protein